MFAYSYCALEDAAGYLLSPLHVTNTVVLATTRRIHLLAACSTCLSVTTTMLPIMITHFHLMTYSTPQNALNASAPLLCVTHTGSSDIRTQSYRSHYSATSNNAAPSC
jgi:hypothetical protein